MDLHIFNMKGLLEGKERYGHLKYAYGTFDLDSPVEWWHVKELDVWCGQNCNKQYVIFDTYASYPLEGGIKDVTVIAFKEEADAVAFKLMWA